jgi:two-component system sensor histidine kinase KdpD
VTKPFGFEVLAVVAVAIVCGLACAIPVSVASMLAFNFLFLPPLHTFALRESKNWVAPAVYLIVGVVVGELATRSRRLAREAVEAETLRQADAVKTAVLHAVSHDLRSPLTAIRAASEGLDNPSVQLDARERDELFETIRIEVQRLERLVENLLAIVVASYRQIVQPTRRAAAPTSSRKTTERCRVPLSRGSKPAAE